MKLQVILSKKKVHTYIFRFCNLVRIYYLEHIFGARWNKIIFSNVAESTFFLNFNEVVLLNCLIK